MALVVGIGVVLGGCSTPAPEVEKTPSVVSEAPSPTPTPTPVPTGPVKPERPADMDRTDEVGAAAAATYFLELYPYVMATGDLEEWDAMTFAELCGFCTSVRDQAQEIANDGDTYRGGEIDAVVIKGYPLDDLVGGYPLDVNVAISDAVLINSSGLEVDRQASQSKPYRVEVLHDGTLWRVLTVSSDMPVS
ncbi:DUF6318 family protein [Oerskovia merdavium]|uniref:DUF6318 domain-containing protein n=1 Tax=Oerskovia merdavium TaxID=2762227 RepID=A0ABR8U2Q8_9CELL|nr:DUF6318 family protein [Oerskovia merdavium]MBD7982327.1 hypothetical protein [Oerskovia merdavium]